MYVFMLNVLNYITVSRAVCNVLKIEKRKLHTKKWFYIFLSLSIHSNRTKNLKDIK